ncbi:MAG: 50S ribosomal protein L6 [Alphaproteobacteria bacterium RIFCSPLOWO2_01_FULL_40_26]|nr:MAG: 50S ribosomal protein L6 [Alphaproteobacteria bacterium RIFCSPHIGHO2_02_FULL_40_34]OFW87856.1 MAG: 50S ribosomal protein L6 [Alphaproteobacteria bacterium RIFCSPHIGHO2_01_FULL_40_8]OFW95091.1 MAG: 50S ribosomal protein L6 [Alphaproteobacteria bacterium RIFCSPLOWO2_01_FULL_40_26]OFX09086.1 MAG: 50S ribosomal protein L6 [Alphaproteobacteria bacterium RIFCSPLOWO2_02_FULL_40_19]OFX12172.1 MAG: 50S ribosomal protein L6 [Alphaproteobacteria bacterium RIFCSPLOWO2_12_FULL_40_11]
MSRVGKLPVAVPDNLKVAIDKNVISFDNGKIKKTYKLSSGVKAEFADKQIKISAIDKSISDISMFVGMDRSNIKNIVSGLQTPFSTTLEINGVGYKASVEKGILTLTLGYSHEIFYSLPKGINAAIGKPNLIIISGDDKVLVGQVSAEIIAFRKPEPYKGKGVKVAGKAILRKEGKKK